MLKNQILHTVRLDSLIFLDDNSCNNSVVDNTIDDRNITCKDCNISPQNNHQILQVSPDCLILMDKIPTMSNTFSERLYQNNNDNPSNSMLSPAMALTIDEQMTNIGMYENTSVPSGLKLSETPLVNTLENSFHKSLLTRSMHCESCESVKNSVESSLQSMEANHGFGESNHIITHELHDNMKIFGKSIEVVDKLGSPSNKRVKYDKSWDKERVKAEAIKYTTKNEFRLGSQYAYRVAIQNNWYDDVCAHLENKQLPARYWHDKERCRQEALKYKTRSSFQFNAPSSYGASLRNNWLDEVCSHMKLVKLPNRYWYNKEICQQEAMKYKSRGEFQLKSRSAYNVANKSKWLDDFFEKKK